jgi:hypothetical protein
MVSFRLQPTGLLPDTQHQIVIMSDVQTTTDNAYLSATIDFKTASIPCPTNLRLQKALNSSTDLYTLLWQPVVNTSYENLSNCSIPVSGYAIYFDGQLVHQILDPNGMCPLSVSLAHWPCDSIGSSNCVCSDC